MMLKSTNFNDETVRNILIKISLFCLETEIGNFVNVIDDLDELFNRFSPELEELFDTATFRTSFCDVGILNVSPSKT